VKKTRCGNKRTIDVTRFLKTKKRSAMRRDNCGEDRQVEGDGQIKSELKA